MRTRGTKFVALSLLLITIIVGTNIPRGAAASSPFVDRASVDSNNVQGNAASTVASITSNGRFVLFGSSASNLVPGDTNGFMDAFLHDRLTGTTERVSVSSSGVQGNGDSMVGDLFGSGGAITPDGRFVAFNSQASNLVPGDTNGAGDVFVHDRVTGTTEIASVNSSGVQGIFVSGASPPSISANGTLVAFDSQATNLVPGQIGVEGVFVHNRLTGRTIEVSVNGSGVEGNAFSFGPTISRDGRFVVLVSQAATLVPGDTNGALDVFVRNLSTSTTERVSVDSNGVQGNGSSAGFLDLPDISADGRFLAFPSTATNLVPGDTNGVPDIFVHDRLTGITERVSVRSSGTQSDGTSFFKPVITPDGRFVAFTDRGSNLVPGDTNFVDDVFVRDRLNGLTERISLNSTGGEAPDGGFRPAISDNGLVVAFTSLDPLVPGDTNNVDDAYVHDESGISADLSVAKTSAPNPVAVRKQLNYTITIPNNGPNGTPYVNMSDSLPTTVLFLSVTSTQGSCIFTGKGAGGTVSCNIGFIPSAGMVTIIIAVKPTKIGTITNTVAVTGHLPDPNLANNVATVQTTVVKKL